MPQLLALDGAQILINVSSSPGRDLAATNEVGLGTATSWRTLMRTYAQLTTSFVVFCNRVGVDESISFWGGSEVIAPSGQALFTAPLFEEGLFLVDVHLDDLRRERLALPLLRDERPELQVRELDPDRRRARRAWRPTRPRTTWPRPASTSPRATPIREPIGFRARRRPLREAIRRRPMTHRRGRRPTGPLFELPDELAIDTDVARRVIGEFIRGQLRQAGFERAVLGLSGGIDSALVAYLVAEAIGAERLLCVLMPYRTSSPASRADAEEVVGRPRLPRASSSRSARWSTRSSREPASGPDASPRPARQLHGPERMAVLYDRSVTWGGLVVGTATRPSR